MLMYTYDDKEFEIKEVANEADAEFWIRVIGDPSLDKKIKEVQHEFEHNKILTDVLFYAFMNHEYRIIVRQDYYSEFILSLMKYRILASVKWS